MGSSRLGLFTFTSVASIALCIIIHLSHGAAFSQTTSFSGEWAGTWRSSSDSSLEGSLCISMTQSGSNLSGTINKDGTGDFALTGTVSNNVAAFHAALSSSVRVSFTDGGVSGKIFSGRYSVSAKAQTGTQYIEVDNGTFRLTRKSDISSLLLLLLDGPQTAIELTSLTIVGATVVGESMYAEYTCIANYSDGSTATVTTSATWSEDSIYATINTTGFLKTLAVPSDQVCRITASYGGKTANHDVLIKDVPVKLNSIAITGPSQVDESSAAQYTCTANYSDGSTGDVTSSALWGENSDYASISSSGNLTTTAVAADQTFTLTATYGSRTDMHSVTIKNTTPPVIITTEFASVNNMLKDSDLYPQYGETVYANPAGIGVGINWAYNSFLGQQNYIDNRSVLGFNIQSKISGKTINRAILILYPYELAGDRNTTYELRAISQPWSGSTVTYNNSQSIYTGIVKYFTPPGTTAAVEIDVTDMVQYWADGTWNNYGFIMYDSHVIFPMATLFRATWFESLTHYTDLSRRPQLYLEYQ